MTFVYLEFCDSVSFSLLGARVQGDNGSHDQKKKKWINQRCEKNLVPRRITN